MRIPINWLKKYVDLPKSLTVLTDKLTLAGHLLDKIDRYQGATVIDLELRGNRADCYSIFGMAREVAALFNKPLMPPEIYSGKLTKVSQFTECKNKINTPLVKRVIMVVLKEVKIQPSPLWLKEALEAYGTSSINNIVDLTNYCMLELGEPMHAFDLDKIGPNIEIRLAKKGESITTFAGDTLELTPDDLVWANKDAVLSVAGAIGGKEHSITNSTKSVLLEAANYDRANIRRTIYRHNLLTDAGIRHEKDLDPNLVETSILRFVKIAGENKWAKVKPYFFDYYPRPIKPWVINLNFDYLDSLSGIKIKKPEITDICHRLDFKIKKISDKSLNVVIPTSRTDVKLAEDLIEEILRIYGYEKIPKKILSLEIPADITPDHVKQELKIKEVLTGLGFDETISFPFVAEKHLTFNRLVDGSLGKTLKIKNYPSADMQVMRKTLLPNLLGFTEVAKNERAEEIRFFEVGKIYYQKGLQLIEKRKLGIIYFSLAGEEFFHFKGYLSAFFARYNSNNFQLKTTFKAIDLIQNPYEIILDKKGVGTGGQIQNICYAEIDLDILLKSAGKDKYVIKPKYPPQIEDLTLILPKKTYVGEIISVILKQDSVAKVELLGKYKDAYTFRVFYQNPSHTLNDKEVERFRRAILLKLKSKFGAYQKN